MYGYTHNYYDLQPRLAFDFHLVDRPPFSIRDIPGLFRLDLPVFLSPRQGRLLLYLGAQ